MTRTSLQELQLRADADILAAPEGSTARLGSILWQRLRAEAAEALDRDPALRALLVPAILGQPSIEEAIARRLATRLASDWLPAGHLTGLFLEAAGSDPSIGAALLADLAAVPERDPACARLLDPFLFFKGFAAIETHRLAHWLWNNGRKDAALTLQSRSSEVFQTDIHPAALLGRGLFLDHATGFVAGETTVIDDEVSILHGVTLGGSGTKADRRHPKIRTGVLIGAGAQVIGDVEIGAFSKIAAGSVVMQPVPERSTAAGVPARMSYAGILVTALGNGGGVSWR